MSAEAAEVNRGWGWLQKPWWFFRDVMRSLKPARFSFFVALVGAAIFLLVQQGTEVLRALAERHADTGKVDLHPVVFFYGALLIWSLHSWYWARVLLAHRPLTAAQANFTPSDEVIDWFRLHGPRILGVLPPLLVAWGCFFIAPAGYSGGAAARITLYKLGAAAVLMAVLLYLFFILRRRWLEEPVKKPTKSSAGIWQDRGTLWAALAFAAFALVLLVLFWSQPVKTGLYLGSGAILCLAAATWVCFGSVVVLASGRLRLPLIGLLILWAMLCSRWNDNHAIRTVPTDTPPRTAASSNKTPVKDAVIAWHDAVQKAYPMAGPAPRPVFIVTTEGGGIRAAYWTAVVLSALQDQSLDQRKAWIDAHPGQPPPPDFASHLFAISGVSGGSVGAVVFNALLAENVAYPMENKAHDILRQDFLSPTLAAMFFPDLLQRFLPVPFASADRAAALETAWEYGWGQTISGSADGSDAQGNRLAQPFRKLWQTWKGEVPLPALFLNGTRVESGKRIIASNLPITSTYKGEFADAEDAEEELGNNAAARDIPVSTAAHMSARFTYVSPAGLLPDGGHEVDGGYFENSGAATGLEVLYEMEAAIEDGHWPEPVVPIVIEIRNGPTQEKPDTRKETLTAPKDTADSPKDAAAKEKKTLKDFLCEVLAPINTLVHTREARGTLAQEAIEGEQLSQEDALKESHPEITLKNRLLFGLHDSPVPLPLGWMLSGDAANEMRRQLHANDDNQKNAGDVMAGLLGTRPAP
jgi:hypothetical protein